MKEQQTKVAPIGQPTRHPAGFATGGAAGAAAGAVAGSLAGPVGTFVGGLAGGIIGARAGEEVSAAVNPAAEESYWRENYKTRPYVRQSDSFETYSSAYDVGYTGYGLHGTQGRSFDESESELSADYQRRGNNSLPWENARTAARDAWQRVEKRVPGEVDGNGY